MDVQPHPNTEPDKNHPVHKWHDCVKGRSSELLEGILAEDAVLYSPVVHTPQKGKAIVLMYLTAAGAVFNPETFKYTKEVVQGNFASLEFECELDGIMINGID